MKKYHQLTSQQRSQISVLNDRGCRQKEIAAAVGCSPSTISRELRRNANKHGAYTWQKAQTLAMERRHRSVLNARTPGWVLHKAARLILEQQWSPRQISGTFKLQGISVSAERIYQMIRDDPGGELAANTRHRMKYTKHSHHWKKAAGRSLIPNRVSIHDRPAEADGTRWGDWEVDLVIGKGHKSAVLTVVERLTNMFLQIKVDSKKPEHVARQVWRLLLPYKPHVLTITTDNGVEFSHHEWIARKLGTKVYFADPYCSGQKGAVENANKLLRQYFPKGTDFRLVPQRELDLVQYKINRRPREKLGFSTPLEEFLKHLR